MYSEPEQLYLPAFLSRYLCQLPKEDDLEKTGCFYTTLSLCVRAICFYFEIVCSQLRN